MKDIAIFRHASTEGPGYLAQFLERHQLAYRLIRVDQDDPLPESIADLRALVFMGGPMSVNDPLPWIPKLLGLIQAGMRADLPMLGHCLGGQLISKALGGAVSANPVKEIGWLPVQKIPNRHSDEWLNGLPAEFEVFHWHGETFSLPPGAQPLLKSANCPNQAFVLGKTLGLQCHVEMLPAMIHDWAKNSEEIAVTSATVQSQAQMTAQLDRRIPALQHVADVLYSRWLQGLR